MFSLDPRRLPRLQRAGVLVLVLILIGDISTLVTRQTSAAPAVIATPTFSTQPEPSATARASTKRTTPPRATPSTRTKPGKTRKPHGICSPRADFNGDGYTDVAVGVPSEDLTSSQTDAGAVNVLYGGRSGLGPDGNQFWTETATSVGERSEKDDLFGTALADGDFDGDGFSDLAIGVPAEGLAAPFSPRPQLNAGAVVVLYGTRAGLASKRSQFWSPESPGVPGEAHTADRFGSSLTAGDFDGDGFADLAVGSPFRDLTTIGTAVAQGNTGAATILYGGARGLSGTRAQLWTQDEPGTAGSANTDDSYAYAMTNGDTNKDGACDLIVGVPGKDLPTADNAGAIVVLFGSGAGLTATGSLEISEATTGVAGTPDGEDQLGYALTTGDFDGDGFADVAADVFAKDVGQAADAGAVDVLYGSARGLRGAKSQEWTQNSPGVEDSAEEGDTFGISVSSSDLNGDGFGDLAIGVPFEQIPSSQLNGSPIDAAGAVQIIFGSARGLTAAGSHLYTQGSNGVAGTAQQRAVFGWSLASGDFNRDGRGDIAAGAMRESYSSSVSGAGGLITLPRGAGTGSVLLRQGASGVKDTAETDDTFGASLA